MKRFLALALAVVAITGGTGAHAAPGHTARRPAHQPTRREWLAAHLPLDPAFGVVLGGEDEAVLFRAGDLDHDGGADVVDARYHRSSTQTGDTEALRLEAHRGRDGALLWSTSLGTATFSFVVASTVGANGAPGLIAVQYTENGGGYEVGYTAAVTLTVTAIDGAGKQAWQRTFAGTYSFGPPGEVDSYPYVAGLFDATPGGGADLLVVTGGSTSTYVPFIPVGDAAAAVQQLVVVDGATGVPRPLGAPIPATGTIDAAPTGDLNGDGAEDAVTVHVTGTTVQAIAMSGATGAPLWVVRNLPAYLWTYVQALPDVTGDGVADVALRHSEVPADPLADLKEETVSLLDGKTGALKWNRPGGDVYALGDIDHKPGSEVALTRILTDPYFGVAVSAYGAAGTALWNVKRELRGTYSGAYGGFAVAGDVDADGVSDLGYGMSTQSRDTERYEGGTIVGRTGKILLDPVRDLYIASVAFDGHGDDSISRTSKDGKVTVIAWRGDSGRKLWQTSFANDGEPTRTMGFKADGDACGDTAVSVSEGGMTTDYVLSGANGMPLWTLARSGDAAPHLVVAHPASHHRYARTC